MNKYEFTQDLIRRSKGDRTINEYASDSDISYAYVSNMLNGKLPASEKIFEKIIIASNPPLSEVEIEDAYEAMKRFKIEDLNQKIRSLGDEDSSSESQYEDELEL